MKKVSGLFSLSKKAKQKGVRFIFPVQKGKKVSKKGVRFIFLVYFLDVLQKINLTPFSFFMLTLLIATVSTSSR